MKRTREAVGEGEVPVISDDFSGGRAKETVEPCIDLASVVGETGKMAVVISEPCLDPCEMEATVSCAGALEREFSEGDECDASTRGRRKTEIMMEETCFIAARARDKIDEVHNPRTCRHSMNW